MSKFIQLLSAPVSSKALTVLPLTCMGKTSGIIANGGGVDFMNTRVCFSFLVVLTGVIT